MRAKQVQESYKKAMVEYKKGQRAEPRTVELNIARKALQGWYGLVGLQRAGVSGQTGGSPEAESRVMMRMSCSCRTERQFIDTVRLCGTLVNWVFAQLTGLATRQI